MIKLFILPFQGVALEALEEQGAQVMGEAWAGGKSEDRRRGFFAGRAALAGALRCLGVEAVVRAEPDWGFLKLFDPGGKEIPSPFVSISHTKEVALVGVGTDPIGIDAEKSDRCLENVLSRIATDEEKKGFNRVLKRDPTLSPVGLWCAKEACLKAVGLGLRTDPKEVVVDYVGASPYSVQVKGPISMVEPAVILGRHQDLLFAVCSERGALQEKLEFTPLTV